MSSYGLWLSASGMQLNEYRQNVLANNMANAHTAGFKQDYAVVAQRSVEQLESASGMALAHPVFDAMSGGLSVQPTFHSFAQGPVLRTGRPLDVALDGEGFFAVRQGETERFTRDGTFTIDSAGQLALTVDGARWLATDVSDAPILLTGTGKVDIKEDGKVQQGGAVVGRLKVVQPNENGSIRKAGSNLFELESGEMVPASPRVVGGALEQSNFDVMTGLSATIEAARAYQINANMIRMQDELTGQAVSRIGRVA